MKRALFGLVLAGALTFGPAAPAQERDDDPSGLRMTAAGLQRVLDVLRPRETRDAGTYFADEVKAALDGIDPQKIDLSSAKGIDAAQKVVELYRKGGFEVVKKLAKEGKIDVRSSELLAAFRNAMVAEVIGDMAGKLGEVRVNDFSTAPTAQSDIDQTFHPVLGPDGETLTHPETGEPLTGGALKQFFNAAYEKAFGIHPERMECSSHAAEATVPDWRQNPDHDDFALRLAEGSEGLRNNPEAYFLEGAFRRQVDRRSFQSETPLFRMFRPLRTKETTADVIVVKRAGQGVADVTTSKARYEVYRDTPPEWRKGYAFGASVGNLFFFQHHDRPEEAAERSKYLMRSMEDGMGSLALTDTAQERLYFDLSPRKRWRMIRRVYADKSSAEQQRIFRMYEVAEGIRTRRAEFSSPAVQREVYAPFLIELVKETFPDKPASIDSIPADDLPGFLKDAGDRFRADSHALMVENCVRAAGPRVRDWLNPERIDPKKIPPQHRKAFEADPKTFEKNLRLSALSELHDAFSVMDPDTVDRVIAAESNPEYRAALADVKKAVLLKQELVAGSRTKQWWMGQTKRIRALGADVGKLGGEFRSVWQDGSYTRGERLTHMHTLVLERLGHRRQGDLQKLDAAGQKTEGKWGTKKLAGKVFNLGNADSVIQMIRAGQDSGWDPYTVGWVATMEVISNINGVAPVLAIKGALFDGEFEGAAVLVAAYFVPGVGQAYMVFNIVKGAVQIVAFEVRGGIAELLYQGYMPQQGGVWNTISRYSPGRLTQDFIVSRTSRTPPTLLHFVPGANFEKRRLNVFEHFDPRLADKLKARGLSGPALDEQRQKLAEPMFRKVVNDYCDLRPGTEFGDDAGVRRAFQAIYDETGGSLLQGYLESPDIRRQLRDRMVKDYLGGLRAKRIEEGQEELEETQGHADEAAALVRRVEDGLRRLGAGTRDMLPIVSGLPDWSELDEATIDTALTVDMESEPEIRIVPPKGGIDVGKPGAFRAEVYAPPGRFVEPYVYEWSVDPRQGSVSAAGEREGLGFVSGELNKKNAAFKVRVTVTDAVGADVGEASRDVNIGEIPEMEWRAGGDMHLLKLTTVRFDWKPNGPQKPADVVTNEAWIPVRVTKQRTIERALQDLRAVFVEEFKPNNKNGKHWEGYKQYVESWTLEIVEGEYAGSIDPAAVPQRTESRRPGAGPVRPR